MSDPAYKAEPSYDVLDALRLVPLFYTVNWTPEKKAEWLRITGSSEATTKVMCDHIRSLLAIMESGPGPRQFSAETVAAYADVVRQADAIYRQEQNDIQDRRAVRTFADRFRTLALSGPSPHA